MNARELVAALACGRWHGTYGTARCPAHDDRSPSLGARDAADGKLLVRCHAGCEQTAVIDALRARGLWPGEVTLASGLYHDHGRKRRRTDVDADRVGAAQAIWCSSCPAPATIVETYLREHRGLRGVIPPTIRCAYALRHGPSGLILPTMVAAVAVWPSRAVEAVHRTYLDPENGAKAHVEPTKMMLGRVGGGAVRLGEVGEQLAVSEGLETGLLAQYATGIPTWAALSAVGMERIVLPALPLAREVFILADNDTRGRGLAAARILARDLVFEGRTVRIALPETTGTDWADVLREGERGAA
jgi:hypothetical protein